MFFVLESKMTTHKITQVAEIIIDGEKIITPNKWPESFRRYTKRTKNKQSRIITGRRNDKNGWSQKEREIRE